MFKKILLPTDGSEAARRAAQSVATLAAGVPDGVQVVIVCAVAPLNAAHSDLAEDAIARRNEQMRQHAQAALDTAAAIFTEYKIAHTTKVLEGDPVSEAIAQEIGTGGYDLVALGSRGMGMSPNDKRYVGSVTEHVIRRVSVPVLVLPVHKEG